MSTAETATFGAASSEHHNDFDVICERTRAALRELAARWRDAPHPSDSDGADAGVAGAASRTADDPTALTREGLAWSLEAGLNFVLPQDAIRGCKPVAQSPGRDGLQASDAGGPRRRTHPGLFVAPAPPCGFGVFAAESLPRGAELGEYLGEVRDYAVWVEEIKQRKRDSRGTDDSVPFIPEELYAAWTGSGPKNAGVVVDAFAVGNTMRFINCSCTSNCTFKPFGQGGEGHSRLEVVTTRVIQPFEQLSVDYGWYFDDLTLQDVRAQAVKAYNADRPALEALAVTMPAPPVVVSVSGAAEAEATAPQGSEKSEGSLSYASEAVRVLADAVREVRGRPRGPPPANFLRRFVDPEAVALLLERHGDGDAARAGDDAGGVAGAAVTRLPEASGVNDIPDAVWPMYEVVGAARVGIPCRCALEPSLNRRGRCSGIIGRPMQDRCSGRDDAAAAELAPHWL